MNCEINRPGDAKLRVRDLEMMSFVYEIQMLRKDGSGVPSNDVQIIQIKHLLFQKQVKARLKIWVYQICLELLSQRSHK